MTSIPAALPPVVLPAPSTPAPFVDLGALGRALARVTWAPLRLATGAGERQVSPRLPHAIVLHLALELREAAGQVAPPSRPVLVPDPGRLGAVTAAPVATVERIIEALRAAGVLVTAAETPDAVRLPDALLGPAPRAGRLDWREIAAATVGSPSAWVLAHQLASALDAEGWTPVSRAVLADALGCGTSGVRAAVDRLASAGVIERREQRGGVSVYRFAPAVTGAARQVAARVAAPVPRVGDAPAPPAASPPVLAPDSGAQVRVGGVAVDVPAGMRVVVSIGSDGRPTITIESA